MLSKARKRWGKEVFVSLFSRVVQQCVAAGLVEERKIHLDASLVDANASLRSVKPLDPELIKAIERTAKEQVQKLDEQEDDQDPSAEGGGGSGSVIGQHSKTNRQFQSTTDPDATLVRYGERETPGLNSLFVRMPPLQNIKARDKLRLLS